MNTALSTLALPSLSPAIPNAFRISGKSDMPAALAIALLEANVITDDLLRAPPGPLLVDVFAELDEAKLSAKALSVWWDELRASEPTKFLKWNLHVQQLDHTPDRAANEKAITGWFCLTRAGNDVPRFAIGAGMEKLERTLPGFGQTVLAVLYDAMLRLPENFTPFRALGFAEWIHWRDSQTDEELLEDLMLEGGFESIQAVLDDGNVLTREVFYADMPYWATSKNRKLSRDEIVAGAKDKRSRDVIKACDAIFDVVSAKGFDIEPWEIGSGQAGLDPTDACVILLWRDLDVVGQVIDDAVSHFWDGESSEMIDVYPVPLTAKNIQAFQSRALNMLKLARATETLIELVGERL